MAFAAAAQFHNPCEEGVEMSSALIDPYFMKSERLGFRCWSLEDFPLATRELWGEG
jgi:hypothetical protein